MALGFLGLWVVSLLIIARLVGHTTALSEVIQEQALQIEEQAARIAHLEDRLRILEAVEDLQTSLTPRNETRLARHVYEFGKAHDIPPLLLLAIIQVESSFGTHAVSARGARGLMQVKPSTGRWVVSQLGVDWPGDDRLFEPGFNLWLGTRYLAQLIHKFGGVEEALIAYNWGETAVRRRLTNGKGLPRSYLRRVQSTYRDLQRHYGAPSPGPFTF